MKRAVVGLLLAAGCAVVAGCGGRAEFSPQGEIDTLPDEFRWPSTKAASSYLLQVFAEDGTTLYESRRLAEARKPIGEGLAAKLEAAGSFTWRVRIYDGDRIAGRSDPLQVRLSGSSTARSSP